MSFLLSLVSHMSEVFARAHGEGTCRVGHGRHRSGPRPRIAKCSAPGTVGHTLANSRTTTFDAMSATEGDTPFVKRRKKEGDSGRKRKKKKKANKKGKPHRQEGESLAPSNWGALKEKLASKGSGGARPSFPRHKRRRSAARQETVASAPPQVYDLPDMSRYVACDCEMVGIGAARTSALARASLVDWNGRVLYDKFVRPDAKITDFRTRVSGVRKRDMDAAVSFRRAQREVAAVLSGKILVGHALKNDMSALEYSHPEQDIRDTACYRPLLKQHANGSWRPNSLKALSAALGHMIQGGEHSSVEDARASMMVFRKYRDVWERSLLPGGQDNHDTASVGKKRPRDDESPTNTAATDIFASKAPRVVKTGKKKSRAERRALA